MKSVLQLIGILLLPIMVWGQQPGDAISGRSFNRDFLEQLIHNKMNAYRESIGLRPMAYDKKLHDACRNHVDYLADNNKLGHLQEKGKFATEKLRVEYFAGKNYRAQENVGLIYLNKKQRFKSRTKSRKKKKYINLTYRDVADDVVNRWIYYKKNRGPILDKYSEVNAVAVSYDDSRDAIRVVQLYANVKWQYEFEEDAEYEYSTYESPKKVSSFVEVNQTMHKGKHVHKLKTPKEDDPQCEDCEGLSERVNADSLPLVYQERKRSIRLFTEDIEMIKELFDHRRDGLAVEIVKYTPYDCGNDDYYLYPSRRNGQCIFNGNLQRPRFKRELFSKWRAQHKAFRQKKWQKVKTIIFEFRDGGDWLKKPGDIARELKKKWKPTYWDYTIGKHLRNPDDYYEVNVAVIQKKKVCKILHFPSTCGETLEEFEPIPMMTDLNMSFYDIDTTVMGLEYTINFEQNKYEYDKKDIQPLLDTLVLADYTVLNAKVKAYSSIEGSEEVNEGLQHKRVESIISVMEEVQGKKIDVEIETKEDWEHYNEVIAPKAEFRELNGKTHGQIKDILSKNKELLRNMEPYLSEQRRAEISFLIKYNFNDQSYGEFLSKRFKMHIDSVHGNRLIRLDHRDFAECLQTKMFEAVNANKTDPEWLFKMEIAPKRVFTRLLLNQYTIEEKYLPNRIDTAAWIEKHYNSMKNLSKLRGIDERVKYNHLNFLVRLWENDQVYDGAYSPRRIRKMVDKINDTSLPIDDIEKLTLNYHYKAANHYYFKRGSRNRKIKNESIEYIYAHYKTLKPTIELALKYASYFSYFNQPKKSMAVLEPFLKSTKVDPRIIAYAMKLDYKHPGEFPNSDYAEQLKDAYNTMGKDAWCELFVGPCNISFQVFDDESLRVMYCEGCGDRVNYGETDEAPRTYID